MYVWFSFALEEARQKRSGGPEVVKGQHQVRSKRAKQSPDVRQALFAARARSSSPACGRPLIVARAVITPHQVRAASQSTAAARGQAGYRSAACCSTLLCHFGVLQCSVAV